MKLKHYADDHKDPRHQRMIRKHGFTAYGVFWALVERMAVQPNREMLTACMHIYASNLKATRGHLESIVIGYVYEGVFERVNAGEENDAIRYTEMDARLIEEEAEDA